MSLSKYSKKVWIPDVGSKPHQPLVNFKFPYREFGKQKLVKRAFQHSWFAKWKWLHYEEDMDKAFCYNCIQAYKEDKLRASNLELAFISKGFNNWKDASVKFKEHESSNCHKDSMINNKKRSHTQLDSRKQVIAFQDRVMTINIKEAQHPLK